MNVKHFPWGLIKHFLWFLIKWGNNLTIIITEVEIKNTRHKKKEKRKIKI